MDAMRLAHNTEGLGIDIGLGLPLQLNKPVYGDALGESVGGELRWPYTARHRSSTLYRGGTAYDSSPTLSSSSASSDSSHTPASAQDASTTHDVLLSYLSPALSSASSDSNDQTGNKVYLLSSGTRHPVWKNRRCRSETFRFPLPPPAHRAPKTALKSAFAPAHRARITPAAVPSPPLRMRSDTWNRTALSPALEQNEPTQGWSPYSSHAPTPRRISTDLSSKFADPRPPSYTATATLPAYSPRNGAGSGSESSRTLVSDDESETDAFGADAAKLARLQASLFLLDRSVSELPLSLAQTRSADVGGATVEEKMAYLCGLGYRYRRTSQRHARKASAEWQASRELRADVGAWWSEDEAMSGEVRTYAPVVGNAVRVVSNTASAVASSCSSPILVGLLAATSEGDLTVRPQTVLEEESLDQEVGCVVGDELEVKRSVEGVRDAMMTPPLSTPELELELGGASPLGLDGLPSPIARPSPHPYRLELDFAPAVPPSIWGCRPYVGPPSPSPHQTAVREMGLSSSVSCPALLDEEVTIERATRVVGSVLARPRPVRGRAGTLFSRGSDEPPEAVVPILARARPIKTVKANHSFTSKTLPKSKSKPSPTSSVPAPAVRVPLRKSSLDFRPIHPNSICIDPILERSYYSAASAYLSEPVASAASAALARRNRTNLPSSTSLPVLSQPQLKGILRNPLPAHTPVTRV